LRNLCSLDVTLDRKYGLVIWFMYVLRVIVGSLDTVSATEVLLEPDDC